MESTTSIPLDKGLFDKAIREGDLEFIKIAHANSHIVDAELCDTALHFSQYAMFKWLFENVPHSKDNAIRFMRRCLKPSVQAWIGRRIDPGWFNELENRRAAITEAKKRKRETYDIVREPIADLKRQIKKVKSDAECHDAGARALLFFGTIVNDVGDGVHFLVGKYALELQLMRDLLSGKTTLGLDDSTAESIRREIKSIVDARLVVYQHRPLGGKWRILGFKSIKPSDKTRATIKCNFEVLVDAAAGHEIEGWGESAEIISKHYDHDAKAWHE
ncbi:uncharacterized protein ACA1_304330 [Acanthamoeba castellanii str. Neff]|uniref:Uncharacterized protein n=1 Tax=Acanthamoeba castellanii (strain ATCC 30010 / Neff) TaxID=1257118 RepID=L8GY27_ACACF|nr:uncharacterized protein ACA1_304330 [Acanthamoeba castellanii str. Neff]ELR16991.1 hypothetical protein ACA1_304330 [Acanthamoeba castellanii str. Neff]